MDILQAYCDTATGMIEDYCGRLIFARPASYIINQENVPARPVYSSVGVPQTTPVINGRIVNLPSEAVSVDTVTLNYWDGSSTVLTLGDDYNVDCQGYPARVRLLNYYQYDWYWLMNVTIGYTAGLFANDTDMDPKIRLAVAGLVARMKFNRGDKDEDVWTPMVESFLTKYKIICLTGPTEQW